MPNPIARNEVPARRWLRWDTIWILVALATVFLVRATLGYRPFPSIDDFAYLPLSWDFLNPSLFPKDDLMAGFGNHQIAYAALVAIAERTLGLPTFFFLVTLLLTALSVFAIARLMRTLGVEGYLLPFALALSAAVVVRGLGRGGYDGLIGDAVHGQWIAILLSLLAFDALLRDKPLVAGSLLGLAAYGQSMLAFHSALAIGIAGLFLGRAGLRSTMRVAIAAILVSLPLLYSLSTFSIVTDSPAHSVDWTAIAEAYLFRAPHHYDFRLFDIALVVLIVSAGAAALARIADLQSARDRRAVGLYLGISLLFIASVAFYSILRDVLPAKYAVATYILDLSRSTPLLFALAGVFLSVALERDLTGTSGDRKTPFWGRLAWTLTLVCTLALLTFNMRHQVWVYLGLALSLMTVLAFRLSIRPIYVGIPWMIAGVAAAIAFIGAVQLDAEVSREEGELYTWAQTQTSPSALFIVPPGFQKFRAYAKRGVYVDFKVERMAQPHLIGEWKRRLTLVAHPDRLAQQSKGWDGVAEWDRTYAARNKPERIAFLLQETGSDFFIFDQEGLKIPPFVDTAREPSPRLETAFENQRFTVYRLKQDEGN
jgi:hypothetical protein